MARKRFSDLERVYNALKLAKVNIDTLPANLDIRKYANWKEGETPDRNIVRPSLGASKTVGIIMFGLISTNALAKVEVKTNTRAFNRLKGLGNFSLLGIEETTLTGYNPNSSFIPAKLTFTEKGAKVATTSDITGRKYKKNGGKSYTLPFGQTTANKHYLESLLAILDNTDFTDDYFLSGKQEEFRRD